MKKKLIFYIIFILGNFCEVRTGQGVKEKGIFFRILDRSTDWSIHDGLQSVVTETLQFGLLGTYYILLYTIMHYYVFKYNGKETFQICLNFFIRSP